MNVFVVITRMDYSSSEVAAVFDARPAAEALADDLRLQKAFPGSIHPMHDAVEVELFEVNKPKMK